MEHPVYRQNSLLKRSKLTPRLVNSNPGKGDKLLRDEETITKEITELLENEEQHRDRRRKISHRIWEQNVYQPVNQKIRTTFDSEFGEFRRRRNSAYDDYIDKLNRQTSYHNSNHVFLDIDSPDYDAFAVRRNSIRVSVRTDRDPNKVQRRKLQREFDILCSDPAEEQISKVS